MSAATKIRRQQKHVLRAMRYKEKEARAAALAGGAGGKPLLPQAVHTHPRQPVHEHKSFAEFLARQPPLCERSDSHEAYRLADYCTQSTAIMTRVLRVLYAQAEPRAVAVLSGEERAALRSLRDRWRTHVLTNAHTLWLPPPAAGGVVMRFSLALQLWLLVAHANLILQLCGAVGDLFQFCPAEDEYLLRNALVVDTACVMQYPMRTLMVALECFVERLDQLDRLEPSYARYAVALEHRLSELVCVIGTPDEFNAHEWCVPGEDVAAPAASKLLGASVPFVQYTLAYVLTIGWYAERYEAVHTLRILRTDIATEPYERIPSRVPLHAVLQSDWLPSQRSVHRALDFFCRYAHGLLDDSYTRSLRGFLLEFELRPCDLDLYRMLRHNNTAFARSALEYEFQNANALARTYINRVHYDRSPYSYMHDYVQWTMGDPRTTRSASLDRDGMVRQLVLLYLIDQFVTSKYQVRWRERFLLFHRDTGFHAALARTRTFAYPIVVQQFARFTVVVPHRHPPEHDVRRVLYWRAQVRAKRTGEPLGMPAPPDRAPDSPYLRHARAYDAATALEAFAIWSLWFLVLNDAAIDSTTSMKDFLIELFGWQ